MPGLLTALWLVLVPVSQPSASFQVATVQVLDKVTARVSRFEARPLLPVSYGTIDIEVKRCWKSSDHERPEQAALLEIRERQPSGMTNVIFSGWMFASSPALSALEHPVYDVTLLACIVG